MLAAGILIACGTMFPRILLYAAVISPGLIPALLPPITLMGLTLYLPALYLWRRHRGDGAVQRPTSGQNPLELRTALFFGVLLAVIMLLGEWLRRSEERRVGKECRSRWSADHEKKKEEVRIC